MHNMTDEELLERLDHYTELTTEALADEDFISAAWKLEMTLVLISEIRRRRERPN